MAEDSGASGNTANAGLMAGIDATGSILTALGNRRHERKMAQANREWDLKMWNLNNVYNSPIEQRKRLLAGGYNPQLALPSAGNSSGMVHSSPQSSIPLPDPGGIMSKIYGMQQQAKNIELTQAQIDATKQQAKLNGVKTTHEEWKEALTHFDYDQKRILSPGQVSAQKYDLESRRMQNERLEKELRYLDTNQQNAVLESMARVRQMAGNATKAELEAQILEERKKWMVLGMTSAEAAQAGASILKSLIPF